MTRSILVIMTQEGRPRINATSANQSQGPNKWSAFQGDVLGSPASINKHCKNRSTEGSPKISKEKAATTALNALQLIFWLH